MERLPVAADGAGHEAGGCGRDGGATGLQGHRTWEGQEPTLVALALLRPSDSPRTAGEDSRHVQVLAESETPLPPIVVHRPTMRVIDGMHRLRVAELRGETHAKVLFFDGSEPDAFVLAVRLNATHGLPLSRADRAQAADRVIRSHPQWSDRLIAAATGLATRTVSAIRKRSTENGRQLNTRIGRDGRSRPLSAAEGRRRAGELMARRPEASLREISEAAGIALATTRDVRERLRLGQDPVPPKLRAAELKQTSPAGTGAGGGRKGGAVTVRTAEPAAEPATAPRSGTHPALDILRRDPSLRFTEVGRRLMFLLSLHSINAPEWQRLVDAVPAHCSRSVAQVARQCAEEWLWFADRIENNGRMAG